MRSAKYRSRMVAPSLFVAGMVSSSPTRRNRARQATPTLPSGAGCSILWLSCRSRRWNDMTYEAPIAEMRFALDAVAGLPEIARLPRYEEATADLVGAILEEAGKLAGDVLAPLNHAGDRQGPG